MQKIMVNERIKTTEVNDYVGQRVKLQGWLHALRQLGGVTFVILRDGWGVMQAVTESAEDVTMLSGLAHESVIEMEGVVVASEQAPAGVELHQPKIGIITPISTPPPLPLHKNRLKAQLPTQLNHATVVNRHPSRRAIFRLAAGAMAGFRQTLNMEGFTEVQTPKLVASATESGANVFAVDYFGQKAYLAQSPQFYKQIMVGVFERVYEVAPVFRAESHNTARHINEYVSLDVEFGFIENHETVMAMAETVVYGMLAWLEQQYAAELAQLKVTLPIRQRPIPSIHFNEAQKLIWERHGVDVRGEPDLSPQDERWLGKWAQETHQSDFLLVWGQPMVKRPFYTHPDPNQPENSRSFDLLFRGMELITGGQRRHIYANYVSALENAGMPLEPFTEYLEVFKHGMPPHGGFAIGLERFLLQLTGLANVRLTTLFPRDIGRLVP